MLNFLQDVFSSPVKSGSLVEGRKYLPIYFMFAFLALLVIFSFLVIKLSQFLKKIYREYKKSDEYLARLKNRHNTHSDFVRMQQFSNFLQDEADIFCNMCERFNVPNINFSFKDYAQAKQHIKTFLDAAANENEKALIFSAFVKMQRAHDVENRIFSSIIVAAGTALTYIDHDGKKYTTHVAGNEKQYLILAIPVNRYGNEVRPKELSKLTLLFEGKNERMCSMENRVICYKEFSGSTHLFVSHTTELQYFLKHEFFYITQKVMCNLTKVVPQSNMKGLVSYADSGASVKAELLNFSGVSCNFLVREPVGIRVYVKLVFSTNQTDAEKNNTTDVISNASEAIVALVMNVSFNEDTGIYLMHANFIELDKKIKNDIYAKIYGF